MERHLFLGLRYTAGWIGRLTGNRDWTRALGRIGLRRASLWLVILLGLALRLPLLDSPSQVVFDEVHFGKFMNAYCCSHELFFDIHPPHAKLILSAIAKLGGYDGNVAFNNIGDTINLEKTPLFFVRLGAALAGVAIPAVFFALLAALGASGAACFLGAMLLVFDNGLWVQTRIIALDGYLLLAILAALVFALKARRESNERRWIGLCLACGSACGLAVGSKFTGLTAPALVGLIFFIEFWSRPDRQGLVLFVRRSIWILTGFTGVYLLGWYIHFALLREPASGAQFYIPSGDFFADLVAMHRIMFKVNYNLTAAHHDASVWWTWPWMAGPVYYWGDPGRAIYFIGNPVVWWGSAILFVASVVTTAMAPMTTMEIPKAHDAHRLMWIPLFGAALAFLPHANIPRALFLYHYLPTLLFVLLWTVLWLDRIGFTRLGSPRRQRKAYWVMIGLLVGGFGLMLPLTSGLPLGDGVREALFRLFPTWP